MTNTEYYQQVLGVSEEQAAGVELVHFSWGHNGDTFQMYGTLFKVEGKPYLASTYEWDTGPCEDVGAELSKRLTEMGHPCEVDPARCYESGNGHCTYYFK